jgi:carbamoyltransferase
MKARSSAEAGSPERNSVWILGIAGSHNSGAALIKDGRVVVAVQTERLVRHKRQPIALDNMATHAVQVISYCLRYAGIDLADLRAIATCTPWAGIHPRFAFQAPTPSSLPRFITVPHHLAHAEYALHYSPLERSIVLVCDGAGTYEYQRTQLDIKEREENAVKYIRDGAKESVSAYAFDGANLKLMHRIAYGEEPKTRFSREGPNALQSRWMASLGHLWEWCALYCHGNRHEAGKVMGLAPFGNPKVYADLDTLSIDSLGEMRINLRALVDRFHSPNVSGADVSGSAHYEDIAAHVQKSTNEFLVELVRFLQARYRTNSVCYSGGVALNSIANEYLRRQLGLNLYMNGSCEDNGTAIGAALAAHHAFTGLRISEEVTDYYGREYSAKEIQDALRDYPGKVEKLPRPELLSYAASALASGSVVGWFQGRSEFGPRALGNRSILADPRNPDMQNILNRRVKRREMFRPYAPAVIEERASQFFELVGSSPVMLRVVPVRVTSLPAVTHVDGTARVQTVNRKQNPTFYDLLTAFEAATGVPVLLNTSFNIAGEPIVETPTDALRTFLRSNMDALFLGDFLVHPT